jgi:hypothetical protein
LPKLSRVRPYCPVDILGIKFKRVENRNSIVIENTETNIDNNSKKTYTEIVNSKQKPMTSVSCHVKFTNETKGNIKKKYDMINQEECNDHSF